MKYFLLSFLLFIALSVSAQMEVKPNLVETNFLMQFGEMNEMHASFVRIRNTSAQKRSIRWVLDIEEAPSQWRFSVCDLLNCYYGDNATNISSSSRNQSFPLVLWPGDTARLILNIFPAGQPGRAEARLNLYDLANSNHLIDAACFTIQIEHSAPLTEAEKSRLRVYPNPVSDFMTISNNTFVRQVWVSNVLGRRVKTFDIANGNYRYDISDLPDGIYLVSMVDAQGRIAKTVRINKKSIRP